MKKMRRALSLMLCGVLVIGMLAGCSSSQSGNNNQQNQQQNQNQEQNNQGGEKKVLKVGMECGYAPYNWTQLDDSNGAVKIAGTQEYAYGYDVMIAKRMAEALGYDLEIHKIKWEALPPAVSSGKIDCAIAGQSITAKRLESVDFTDVYYLATVVGLTRKDTKYAEATKVADWDGATVSSQQNTIWYDVLTQIPNANILPAMVDVPAMIVALTSGKIDALVTDKPTAMAAEMANSNLVMLEFEGENGFEVSQEEINIGISVQKGNDELREKLNAALAEIPESEREEMMKDAIAKQPLAQ